MIYRQHIKDNQYLEVQVKYNKGSKDSWANERRAYYLYIMLLEVDGYIVKFYPQESCNFKTMITDEVKRKSNKAYNVALDNLINDIDFYKLLISKRCNVELDTDALLQAIKQAKNEK